MPVDRRAGDLRRDERVALIERLTSYELPWTGDEGYKKAEVTGRSQSMWRRRPPLRQRTPHCGRTCP